MMNEPYNSEAFTPEEVKAGLLQDLLNYLFKFNNSDVPSSHYDIHITTDGYATIVEWCDVDNEGQYGGSFQFVDEDQCIYTTYRLPDNSSVDFLTKEEFDEYFAEWMKENPGWVQTSYGTWTNEIENECFRKQLEKSEEKEEK